MGKATDEPQPLRQTQKIVQKRIDSPPAGRGTSLVIVANKIQAQVGRYGRLQRVIVYAPNLSDVCRRQFPPLLLEVYSPGVLFRQRAPYTSQFY